jgi:hypothetical protein
MDLLVLSSADNVWEYERTTLASTLFCCSTGRVLPRTPTEKCWVKFVVKQVSASPEQPQGLSYSLTLHDEKGTRLLGFDNAHAIRESAGPGARTRIEYDHKHSGRRIRFYAYADAVTLLADFWTEVEVILQNRSRSYDKA